MFKVTKSHLILPSHMTPILPMTCVFSPHRNSTTQVITISCGLLFRVTQGDNVFLMSSMPTNKSSEVFLDIIKYKRLYLVEYYISH